MRGNAFERGMTLIEVAVVAFLIAVLSGILYKSLNGIIRSRELSEELRSADQTAHHLFGRLTSELSGRAFIPLNTRKEDESSQPTFGGIPKYMTGTSVQSGEFDRDTLRFVSANAAQALVGGPANHGVVEVEYHLAEDPDAPSAAFQDDGPKPLVLVRSEEPAGVSGEEVARKRRVVLPMADNVLSMKFRFLKNGTWQNDWKDSTPPLPEAIEISLRLKEKGGKTELYRTAIPISAKQRAPRSPTSP